MYKKTNGNMELVGWLSETETLGLYDVLSYFSFYQGEYEMHMNHTFEDGKDISNSCARH